MLEHFTISITIRDENGKLLRDSNNAMRSDWRYETKTTKDLAYKQMQGLKATLQTWMPDRDIEIQLMYFDSISRTYPVIAEITSKSELKELT